MRKRKSTKCYIQHDYSLERQVDNKTRNISTKYQKKINQNMNAEISGWQNYRQGKVR